MPFNCNEGKNLIPPKDSKLSRDPVIIQLHHDAREECINNDGNREKTLLGILKKYNREEEFKELNEICNSWPEGHENIPLRSIAAIVYRKSYYIRNYLKKQLF